uniref:SFRICE_017234 n=1 Tax=Spodoptera frugiperda TaxID=7108 RepID=A0A2H1VZA3_SPOFR
MGHARHCPPYHCNSCYPGFTKQYNVSSKEKTYLKDAVTVQSIEKTVLLLKRDVITPDSNQIHSPGVNNMITRLTQ